MPELARKEQLEKAAEIPVILIGQSFEYTPKIDST